MPLHHSLNVTPVILHQDIRRDATSCEEAEGPPLRSRWLLVFSVQDPATPTPPTRGLLRPREGVTGCYQHRPFHGWLLSLIENNEGHPEHMVATVCPPPLSPLLSLEEGSLKLRLCQLKICLLITLLKLDFLVSGRPVSGRRALASQWPVDRRQNVNSAETPPFCIVLIPKTPFVRERRRQFLLFNLEKKKRLFVIETEEWKCQHI